MSENYSSKVDPRISPFSPEGAIIDCQTGKYKNIYIYCFRPGWLGGEGYQPAVLPPPPQHDLLWAGPAARPSLSGAGSILYRYQSLISSTLYLTLSPGSSRAVYFSSPVRDSITSLIQSSKEFSFLTSIRQQRQNSGTIFAFSYGKYQTNR